MTDKDFGFGTSDPHRSGGVQCSYLQHHDGDHFFHAWLYNESLKKVLPALQRAAWRRLRQQPPHHMFSMQKCLVSLSDWRAFFVCENSTRRRRVWVCVQKKRKYPKKKVSNWWESTDPWTLPCTLVFSALFVFLIKEDKTPCGKPGWNWTIR